MSKLGFSIGLAAIVACATGCGQESSPGAQSSNLPGIAVLTEPEGGMDDGLLDGVLRVEGACVVLFRQDVQEIAMVMWPPGTRLEASDDGEWELSSPALSSPASEGDEVSVSGGERRDGDVPDGTIPSACDSTTFWVAAPAAG